MRNLPGVDPEQEEIIHFKKIAARDAQNGLDLLQATLAHVGLSSLGAAIAPVAPLPEGATVRALPLSAQWRVTAIAARALRAYPRAGANAAPRRANLRPPHHTARGSTTDAADFRRIALSLAGVAEYPHFDRRAFKARVTFATLAPDELTANIKFAPDEQALKCAVAPDAFAALDNAWGRQGWTRATLAALSEPELSAALEMAWRHGSAKAKKRPPRRSS